MLSKWIQYRQNCSLFAAAVVVVVFDFQLSNEEYDVDSWPGTEANDYELREMKAVLAHRGKEENKVWLERVVDPERGAVFHELWNTSSRYSSAMKSPPTINIRYFTRLVMLDQTFFCSSFLQISQNGDTNAGRNL